MLECSGQQLGLWGIHSQKKGWGSGGWRGSGIRGSDEEQGLLSRAWGLRRPRARDTWEDEVFPEITPWWSAYELDQGDTGGAPSIRSLNHAKGLRMCEL